MSSKTINALYLNIRSIRQNWDNFLCTFSDKINLLDVIVLVEINISQFETNLFKIDNFNELWFTRNCRKGSGIVIFVKKCFQSEVLNVCTKSFESLCMNLTLGKRNFVVCALYRPPNNNKNVFIVEFMDLLQLFNSTDTVIVGDFNINLFDSD